MQAVWLKIKEWAMIPVLGIPAAVIVAVLPAAAYLFLGKKKGGRARRLF